MVCGLNEIDNIESYLLSENSRKSLEHIDFPFVIFLLEETKAEAFQRAIRWDQELRENNLGEIDKSV
jgi:hypothetical protein